MHAVVRRRDRRDRPPPMCVRQELSAATTISAPVSTDPRRTCRRAWRPETSAFFSANVPPKPQHSSAPASSTRSMPRDRAQQAQRLVAQPQQPQAVAGGVVGHPVRGAGPDVGHAEHVDEQFGKLVGAGGHRRRPRARGAGTARGSSRRTTRSGRRSRRSRRTSAEIARPAAARRARSRSWRASARSRSGRRGTRRCGRAVRSTRVTAMPVLRVEQVVDAGDEQSDPHVARVALVEGGQVARCRAAGQVLAHRGLGQVGLAGALGSRRRWPDGAPRWSCRSARTGSTAGGCAGARAAARSPSRSSGLPAASAIRSWKRASSAVKAACEPRPSARVRRPVRRPRTRRRSRRALRRRRARRPSARRRPRAPAACRTCR